MELQKDNVLEPTTTATATTARSHNQNEYIKPQEERLSEGIELLKQLRDLGVPDTLPSYLILKNHINDWIRNGNLFEDKIPFPTFGRTASVYLPARASGTATLAFRIDPAYSVSAQNPHKRRKLR
jgi:hypothetical protein